MDKILNDITKYGIINKGDRIAVACSGGKDSMALLHYLSTKKDLPIGQVFSFILLPGNCRTGSHPYRYGLPCLPCSRQTAGRSWTRFPAGSPPPGGAYPHYP